MCVCVCANVWAHAVSEGSKTELTGFCCFCATASIASQSPVSQLRFLIIEATNTPYLRTLDP